MSTQTEGVYLRFFVHEARKHGGALLYEWLLERAKVMGIPRGTVFRAIADFGRRKVVHEQRFFELAGDITVRVDFVVTPEQSEQLLRAVDAEKLKLPYALFPTRFGTTDG